VKFRLSRIVLFTLCFLVVAWTARGQQSTTGNSTPTVSPSTLPVHGPATPENHFHLADYFRDLAAREQALAKSYEEIAKTYKAKILPAGLDAASAREIREQFRRLAATERKAAEAAATIAQYHARQAELVDRLPDEAARHANPQDAAFRR
jgi:hypothetical protein